MLSRLFIALLLFCLILSDDLEHFGEPEMEQKAREEPSQSEVENMRTVAISCTLMSKHYMRDNEADVRDAT